MNTIRFSKILSVLLITFNPLFAQPTYPLAKGNVWQFWDYDFLNGQVTWIYGWTTKVVGDTLLSDGKSYAILFSDAWKPGVSFMRQEGSKVFIGLGISHPDSSYVLYDFSKTVGDTMRLDSFLSGDTTLTTIAVDDSGSFFGQKRRYQDYLTESLHSSGYMIDRIADGFGLVYEEMEAGTTWFLRGAIIDNVTYGTIISVNQKPASAPAGFELAQNFPNPFNPATLIRYAVPRAMDVRIEVFNSLGQRVSTLVDGVKQGGAHEVQFDGSKLASGVYFYRMQAGSFVEAKKLLLLR